VVDSPTSREASVPKHGNRTGHARAGASFDPRDAEIARLKNVLEQLRTRERIARAEAEVAQERLTTLAQASRRFAASMRGGTSERHRYRRRIGAQYGVSRVLAQARDLMEAAPEIMQILGEWLGWEMGVLWTLSGEELRCETIWHSDVFAPGSFEEACRKASFARGSGLPGRVWSRGEPVRVENLLEEDDPLAQFAAGAGLRQAIAFPIRDGGLAGVFELFRDKELPTDSDLNQTVALLGRQVSQFVERRRAETEREESLSREREARRALYSILESISDAFFAVDREWRFTYVNRRAEELWSRCREGLLGKNLWDELPQAADSDQYREMRRAMEERTTTSFEAFSPVLGVWVAGQAYPSPNGGVSVYFDDVTERRREEEERERLAAHELTARAQTEERRRLARDLHDRVAHDMALVYQSLELYKALKESDPQRAAFKIELARHMVREALDSTRNLSMELMEPEVRRGLEAALADLLRDLVPPDVRVDLSASGDETLIPPETRNQLFLILREAIRNAVTHAGCSRITVELEVIPNKAVGSVEDDGRGFDVEGVGTAGVGLQSMKERTALLGGELRLTPEPGVGTKVMVSVPLDGER
jgi:PAS domain S-box-containing protein